ncbi:MULTISPECIES: ABC transporter permease [unclassified Acidisoma]|uniref:ABC transporter permease n=1 Tax=unclassified Acidisoma TaxID=2634065 RepID=UPI00131D0C8F|nr:MULTISPECIES: ABC transporter permease [unclassified Acidisoma]
MKRLIIRRLLFGLLTLFLVSVVIFAATEILPGNAARALLGRDATPDALAAAVARLHLDRPLTTQYGLWLGGILTGQPGNSLVNGRSVLGQVMPRVENSLTLLVLAGLVGVPISLLAGIFAASRRSGFFDNVVSVTALGLAATPEFVVGFFTVIVFATSVFHWLPPVSMVAPGASVLARPQILVLPVLTLILVIFPYLFRMIRSSMIEILQSDYVEMARLKGVSRGRIIFVHALPNAIAPTVQVIALTFAYLAGGVVLVEYVFAYPGIGQSLIYAIFARDVPVIQFEVILLAAFYVGLNILADLITILVTPKLRARAWQTS